MSATEEVADDIAKLQARVLAETVFGEIRGREDVIGAAIQRVFEALFDARFDGGQSAKVRMSDALLVLAHVESAVARRFARTPEARECVIEAVAILARHCVDVDDARKAAAGVPS